MSDENIQTSLEERFASISLRHYSEPDIRRVRTAAADLVGKMSGLNNVGLLYGRVQSGKTFAMTMAIARANDQGYRFFIVLTSDNVSLYQQTLERIQSSLATLLVLGNYEISNPNPSGIVERCRTAIDSKGMIIVSTKNPRRLRDMENFLTTLDVASLTAVVFDDEADFGSLNSRINLHELSVVHGLIRTLRSRFMTTKFIQVTATPQALLLQRLGDDFRPAFVTTVEPGQGYIGGGDLYDLRNSSGARNVHQIIQESEIEAIVNEQNYQKKRLEELPIGIRNAVNSFLVGAAALHLKDNLEDKFSMLCHVSSRRSPHMSVYSLVQRYINIVSRALSNGGGNYYDVVSADLKRAYDNLSLTDPTIPGFQDVLGVIGEHVFSSNIKVIISERMKQELSYNSLFNIFIGGERLSRGLTVKKLIVLYYGRMSGAPKVDTKLQHSRIYGYRFSELNVIRIFSTKELFDIFYDVYLSDEDEWSYFNNGGYERNAPVILSLRRARGLRLTRSQVVPIENLVAYYPEKTYFMYYAIPANVAEIDGLLSQYKDNEEAYQVNYELLKKLVVLPQAENPNQRWNPNAVVATLERLERRGIVPYLAVRRDRDIVNNYGAILDPTDQQVSRENGVVLFMYRLRGSSNKGWGGNPLWVPVVKMPAGEAIFFTTKNVVQEPREQDV